MILKNRFIKKKGLSPLITTILLIVVTFALIGIILSWGKNFTSGSLSQSTNFADFKPSDSGAFLTIDKGLNGRFLAEYNPPSTMSQDPITITYYSLLGDSPVPLEPPVTIPAHTKKALDLGIVNSPFDLVLYLDNNTQITKTGLTTVNKYPRDCPEGYIPVPGNFLYGTTYGNKMGFCVAKYEMKVDQDGDGIGDSNTSCQNSSYGTWNNTASGCGYSNYNLVSTPQGYPLAEISQTESIAACESIGGHLITNNEWMTIVRNLEQVPSNWSSGTVGQGYIYSGHNDGNPNNALEASTNDNDGYYGTGNTSGNQRRTLTLSNGETIWDLAGNVTQWVNKIQSESYITGCGSKVLEFDDCYYGGSEESELMSEYNDVYSMFSYLQNIYYKDLFLLNPDYNTDNGVGDFENDYFENENAFLRGGSLYNGSYAGVLTLDLSNGPSFREFYFGLRCVQ